MACSRDDYGSCDSVRVHARLGHMIEGDQRPVCDDSPNALVVGKGVRANDEVLYGSGIEERDVREGEHL